jgi:hypothetical protein
MKEGGNDYLPSYFLTVHRAREGPARLHHNHVSLLLHLCLRVNVHFELTC